MSCKPHYELPDFYLPWPARLNPHVDGARVHSKAWAREIGILDTPTEDHTPEILNEAKFDTMDVGLFCAYSHPDALPPALELITDWIVWAFYFDDYFLEIFKRVGNRAGLVAQLERLQLFMPIDRGEVAPAPVNPMERGLLNLWKRTIPIHTVAWRRRFRASTMDMLNVVDWELRNIKAGRVANPIEFVQWRRPAGGAAWTVYFVEHANLAEVPDRVWKERPLRVLTETFADGVHYRNDLFSYEREVNEEGELSNFVIVLQQFFKIEPQAAANMTNDILSSRLYQFEHTAATEVPVLFEEKLLNPIERTTVLLYIKGLQDWQAGCHEWHLRSSRYTKPTKRTQSTPTLPVGPRGLGTAATRLLEATPESTGLTRFRAYTHVPFQQVGPIAWPKFYMPFRSRLNPHYGAAQRSTIEWAGAMGMLDPLPGPLGAGIWSKQVLESFDLAQLAARWFPDTPGPEFEFAANWIIWATYFDDFFWRVYQMGHDLASAKIFHSRLLLFTPLDIGMMPLPLNPIERGLADLWPRTAAPMSRANRQTFREHLMATFGSWLWELENHLLNRVPDPVDYIEMRRLTIGVELVIVCGGFGQGQRLPSELFAMQPMVELKNAAADCAALINDIVSYQAEIQYEGVLNNAVVVAQNFLGIELDKALAVVNDLITRRLQQFENIVATELPLVADKFELDDGLREALAEHVDMLICWITGIHDWHLVSGRFKSELLSRRFTPHTLRESQGSASSAGRQAGLGMGAAALVSRMSRRSDELVPHESSSARTSSDGIPATQPALAFTASGSASRPAQTLAEGDHEQTAGEAATDTGSGAEDPAETPKPRGMAPLPALPLGRDAYQAQAKLGFVPTQFGSASRIAQQLAAVTPKPAVSEVNRQAASGTQAAPTGRKPTGCLSDSVRRRSRRPTVAVFGGGIAGLTAAHELVERGFDVDVYERRGWGGKARSTEVADSAKDGRRPLPSEHGLRVEFGFYQNIPDTMRRIPFGANPNGVFDNLVELPQMALLRERKHDLVVPFGPSDPLVHTPRQLIDLFVALLAEKQLPPDAMTYFANRLLVFSSSCDSRRNHQWESISWSNFIGGERFSEDYRKIMSESSFLIQAAKPVNTSAKFTGWFLELVLYSLLGFGSNGPTARMLNQPTSTSWIKPWVATLERLGARMNIQHTLNRLDIKNGKIVGAELETPAGRKTITADWFVCALPVERARKLWSNEILAADPNLARMNGLQVAPMTGVQFYLREPLQIVAGTAMCADSPWKMAFAHQAQFWAVDFASTFGDGRARESLSAVVSDWKTPGNLYGKTAAQCNPEEMAREAWEQIKAHVNKAGRKKALTDDMVLGWSIDEGVIPIHGGLVSEDPLPLAIINTERYRPNGVTKIPNLVLAGDYLDGAWQVGTMEAANYYGRMAANAILDAAGSAEAPANAIGPYRPPEWQLLKQLDAQRYANGEANLFDIEGPLPPELARLLDHKPPQ